MTIVEVLIGAGGALMASAMFLLGYLLGTIRGTRRQIDDIVAEEWERWNRINRK